jgi:hypothetical protein
MKLNFRGLRDSGNLENERLVFEVAETCDVGSYVVFAARTDASTGKLQASTVPFCFWFPDKEVKTGDLVVVYSKNGELSVKTNKSGATSHFFYWRLETALWKNFAPVLVEVASWKRFKSATEQGDDETP